MLKTLLFTAAVCVGALAASAQKIHSHNDYARGVPFYEAYAAGAASIEVDIFIRGNELFVAHSTKELEGAPTFDQLYLEPVMGAFKRDGRGFKLLIDLKTAAVPTLNLLTEKLEKHPEVFNSAGVMVVISGNKPAPQEFGRYPLYISFDGELDRDYTPLELERIQLISEPLERFTKWNGKGYMVDAERRAVAAAINKAHALGKPIRFWGSPDGMTAWNQLHAMGVDFINTDQPAACAQFFCNFESKNFSIAHAWSGSTSRPKLLDKTSASFAGFDAHSGQLLHAVPTYTPTFEGDGTDQSVKNIILLIGDGMGINAIQAAETVNGGLTMTKLRHTGLQRTSAAQDYTPDSAGAGSSIATGKPNRNRHIAMSDSGEIYPSVADILAARGLATGVVTNGPLADATPAAFYGHTTERDNSSEITSYLPESKLSLLVGSGREALPDHVAGYSIVDSIDKITSLPTICIDERLGLATTEQDIDLLARTTDIALQKLSTQKNGFFLVVEGAKIDYAGHARSLASGVIETLGFDMAVARALKFADSNPGTLVVITADHETGGLTLIDGNAEKGEITAIYMTDDHTPMMVPVFAYGPRAGAFGGVYPNTEIAKKILNLNKHEK